MSGLRVVINSRKGFTKAEAVRYDAMCTYVQHVVNTVEFRSRVLNSRFTSNKDLTSLQIYQLIMNAAEILSPTPDGEIDVMVELYTKNNSTIGYTYANTAWTYLNNKFFSKYSPAEAGGNLIHEWIHKLGFDHSSAREHSSVPYAVGYIVRDLINEMLSGIQLTPIVDYTMNIPLPVRQKKYVCSRSWKNFFREVCHYE